jgi:hypothetical protein
MEVQGSLVTFFTWTTALGKILTLDNLCKRHTIVMVWCCMCKKSRETLDHLVLYCDIARDLWNLVFQIFGVEWVMPRRWRISWPLGKIGLVVH